MTPKAGSAAPKFHHRGDTGDTITQFVRGWRESIEQPELRLVKKTGTGVHQTAVSPNLVCLSFGMYRAGGKKRGDFTLTRGKSPYPLNLPSSLGRYY